MFNWKYPAVAIFVVAAIVPSLCQNSRIPLVGRAFANQQPRTEIAANSGAAEGQPKPREGKLMMGRNARALKDLSARRKSVRNGDAASD